MPLFSFLVFRWIWHLGLWWYFLWRLQKRDMHLLATHPDKCGGLGYLEVVHECFMPLIFAVSSVLSSMYAEDFFRGKMKFEMFYLLIPQIWIIIMVVFIAPLLMFVRKLWLCRSQGLNNYLELASQYVSGFDHKWIKGQGEKKVQLLGTPDLQSLSDLANSIEVVKGMHLIPIGRRFMIYLAISVSAPMIPLIFIKYQIDQVVGKFFKMIVGL